MRKLEDRTRSRRLTFPHRVSDRPREPRYPFELVRAVLDLPKRERVPTGAEYPLELRLGVHGCEG